MTSKKLLPEREYITWVLTDWKGRPQLYTNGKVVTYSTRREAKADEKSYDPRRQWKATRAILRIPG